MVKTYDKFCLGVLLIINVLLITKGLIIFGIENTGGIFGALFTIIYILIVPITGYITLYHPDSKGSMYHIVKRSLYITLLLGIWYFIFLLKVSKYGFDSYFGWNYSLAIIGIPIIFFLLIFIFSSIKYIEKVIKNNKKT